MKIFLILMVFAPLVAFSQAKGSIASYSVETKAQPEEGTTILLKQLIQNDSIFNGATCETSRLFIRFTVTKEGNIDAVQQIKPETERPCIDLERVEKILNDIKWKPAKKDGKVIDSIWTLPIHIHLR